MSSQLIISQHSHFNPKKNKTYWLRKKKEDYLEREIWRNVDQGAHLLVYLQDWFEYKDLRSKDKDL